MRMYYIKPNLLGIDQNISNKLFNDDYLAINNTIYT